ncbi:4-hydroxy-3-methylbut-2-enyl diphosphate reductase [Tamaricihabitans halophyticus]|uniref:4-hydroxy-3-methylbut-2-enyl diphosphate reductase n=1 Tax=Tamaricihabitans halophyticus TaxID=1262583 RepID=A0A4R2QJW1_9PSEU|nr:4-hydroxy-3-methylbut-2-enyl diphosphate reductase [Tamaricihabitans halophyticus]
MQAIAARCDLVLVVGSSSSSNSRRLVEVAHAAGAAHAFLIDDADGVDAGWLAGVHTVGLSAGASTPETLVDEVLSSLADHGYADVVLATVTIEDVRFELPRELRA